MEGLGERPLLLDVRSSEEYVDGHAPGGQLNRKAQPGQAAGRRISHAFPFLICAALRQLLLWPSMHDNV